MTQQTASSRLCAGCKGKGAHWRWCSRVVGPRAAIVGPLSEEAEGLGDRIGANAPAAANACYAASMAARLEASRAVEEFVRLNIEHAEPTVLTEWRRRRLIP